MTLSRLVGLENFAISPPLIRQYSPACHHAETNGPSGIVTLMIVNVIRSLSWT